MRNLVTSLPNPNSDPDPNPNISGQVESESESEKNGSDPHHWDSDQVPRGMLRIRLPQNDADLCGFRSATLLVVQNGKLKQIINYYFKY